ncbi:MAG: RNA polymerase sigma factor [Butyricimonas paravirosa]
MSFCSHVCRADVAEDIVQEVFEKIWKKSTQIDERESIDSYLFVAVRNACFTFLKNKRERVDLEDVKQNLKVSEEVVEFETPELNRLWGEIENLPLQCKVVFKLVILEDMKYKDVADSLEFRSTVKHNENRLQDLAGKIETGTILFITISFGIKKIKIFFKKSVFLHPVFHF